MLHEIGGIEEGNEEWKGLGERGCVLET